jgi:hypothetical protein
MRTILRSVVVFLGVLAGLALFQEPRQDSAPIEVAKCCKCTFSEETSSCDVVAVERLECCPCPGLGE